MAPPTSGATAEERARTMLRFCVFRGREDVLLVCAPVDHAGPLLLPTFTVPFSRLGVLEACRAAEIPATAIETAPGRWTRSLKETRDAEAGERGNKVREDTALRVAALHGSVDPNDRDRAKLLDRLQSIPTEQRTVRQSIAEAATRASRGEGRMSREEFGALKDREAALKEETIAIQAQLRRLRQSKHLENQANGAGDRESFARRFFQAAKEFLDEETLASLIDAANEPDDDAADPELPPAA